MYSPLFSNTSISKESKHTRSSGSIDLIYMRIAAIGRTEILYNTILKIHNSSHTLDVIVTCGAEDFYTKDEDDFRELAAKQNIDFIETTSLNTDSALKSLEGRDLDVAVSVNWKTLIRPPVFNTFEHGILNYHAGDLPRYRGNATMNWAIIEGEDEVVHTVHRMDEGLDTGLIFLQRPTPLDEETYIRDIYEDARQIVPEMFLQVADGIEAGSVSPRPQPDDPAEALRCYPRKPEDSEIDWDEPAEQIHRVVRASAEPLFGAYTHFKGEKMRVWRSHVESPPTPFLGTPGQVAERRPDHGEVAVLTLDEFLVLEEVETETHGRQQATDIITSNRDRLI
jgi:methionyl-tRNA formyltransferase